MNKKIVFIINNSAFFLTEGPLEKSRANNIEEWIKQDVNLWDDYAPWVSAIN